MDAQRIDGHRPELAPTATAEQSFEELPWYAWTRAALSERVAALSADVQLLAHDRMLHLDGLSRPQLLLEACIALTAGVELLIAPADLAADPACLLTTLRTERIGWLHLPASSWRATLEALNGQTLPLVALLDVTESTGELIAALTDRECAVLSVYRPEGMQLPVAAGWVNTADDARLFGAPLAADALRIGESPEALAPLGVPAPLWVAGPDGAWRRTGSLCRWRTDGVLQYLGELGPEVHAHGMRLDLARLETHFLQLEGISDAGVALQADRAVHHRLVVLVKASRAGEEDDARVQREVRRLLPVHAPAAAVRWVAEIKRSPNGRPDVASSPSARPAAAVADTGDAAGRAGHLLRETWKQLLGVDVIHDSDNFFDLGGTSLMAMQAVTTLEQHLGTRISARRYVFESLGQLAAAYAEAHEPAPPASEPAAAMASPTSGGKGLLRRLNRLVRGG